MKKNLIFDKDSIAQFSGGYILVDNTALIDMSHEQNSAMYEFLSYLNEIECDLITTQAVYQEFIRGAKNLSQSNAYMDLFKELGIESLGNTEKQFLLKDNSLFRVAYCQEAKNASLTDAGLAITAYVYRNRNIGILTSNYKDMPGSLLKKETFFIYEKGNEIRTHAIYRIQDDEVLEKNDGEVCSLRIVTLFACTKTYRHNQKRAFSKALLVVA